MQLSSKMPAQMDSTLPAKQEASMPAGGTPGDGGPMVAPNSPMAQKNSGGAVWDSVDRERGINWDAPDRIWDNPSDGYSLKDRKNTGEGGLPQQQN